MFQQPRQSFILSTVLATHFPPLLRHLSLLPLSLLSLSLSLSLSLHSVLHSAAYPCAIWQLSLPVASAN